MEANNPEPVIIDNSRTPESDGFIFDEDIHDDEGDDTLEREDEEYSELRRTFDENIDDSVALLHYLADAMESQKKHRNPRFLADVKQNTSCALRYARKLQEYEQQINSRSSPNPRTWSSSTPMFFRSRTSNTDLA
ncbi:hypothetical protein M422DRAFT_55215 [Sphaerobolus stellatus SS14]|uniref:Uncharacterized protein n=1 Tax=Sphaerobolus stellatus (strain SS14) TaxID=990650 RepID=A0A0C9TD09_SPHS4|nr:hypothetical protein M422DRAFT_55215 [Sphaerobolus stellatus SS14]